MDILNKYYYATGQLDNLNKSIVTFSHNTPESFRQELAQLLRLPLSQKAGKYLGLPMEWGRSKVKTLGWIKEKILSKIAGWKEKFLNHAGQEVLSS